MINSLNHGPATKIVITLEMLKLLARAAATEIDQKQGTGLSAEETNELKSFIEMVDSTVAFEKANPGLGTTHGFCL